MSRKHWSFMQLNKEMAGALSEECGLDPVLCLLLTGRGITDADEAARFLTGDEIESDPYLFADMDAAVERIQQAIDNGERMLVYGDYDADGVTATVLLYSYLRRKGARVDYRLPHRENDGYGLNCSVVDELSKQGISLIVTVDNGVSAVEEVAYAASHGIDVVVTDHHQPPDRLPKAVAVVDPHRKDCPSVFKDFAGVGMAFFLVCALEGDEEWVIGEYGDLVALGTLADVMPLQSDNRVLVRRGLQRIAAGTRCGLRKLREVAGAGNRPANTSAVTYTLAPRINAAGRMGSPDLAAQLLLCENEEEAECLAQEIHRLNSERQTIESGIAEKLTEELSSDFERLAQPVLVVWGEGWHHGVLGIIAARLQESYGKPTIVLSVKDGIAKGSGRSMKGFSLYDALTDCADCLLTYGGHELAAGLTVSADRLTEFARRINQYAARRSEPMPHGELLLDCKLRPEQIKPDLLGVLSVMEPFGTGNAVPTFALCRMTIEKIDAVGGGKHLRLSLSRDGACLTAMRFTVTEQQFPFSVGDTVDLAVTLDRNEYRGVVSVSVVRRDIRYSDENEEALFEGDRRFDALLRRDKAPAEYRLPEHDEIARVYRALKRGAFDGQIEQLYHAANCPSLDYTALYTALQLLREASLIEWHRFGNTERITVCETQGKTDLMQTPTARYLLQKEE